MKAPRPATVNRADLADEAGDNPWAFSLLDVPFDVLGGVPMLDERFQVPLPPPPEKDKSGGLMGFVHGALDAAGFVPLLGAAPDLLNGGIYGLQGDPANAAWSLGAAFPFAGDAAKGGKMAKEGLEQVIEHGDEAVAATKLVEHGGSRLVGADRAVVSADKVSGYALNPAHPP